MNYFSELLESYNLLKKRKLKLVERAAPGTSTIKKDSRAESLAMAAIGQAKNSQEEALAAPYPLPTGGSVPIWKSADDPSQVIFRDGSISKNVRNNWERFVSMFSSEEASTDGASEMEGGVGQPTQAGMPQAMMPPMQADQPLTLDTYVAPQYFEIQEIVDTPEVGDALNSSYDPTFFVPKAPKKGEVAKEAPSWIERGISYMAKYFQGRITGGVLRLLEKAKTAEINNYGNLILSDLAVDPMERIEIQQAVNDEILFALKVIKRGTKGEIMSLDDALTSIRKFKFRKDQTGKIIGVIINTSKGSLYFEDTNAYIKTIIKSLEDTIQKSNISDITEEQKKALFTNLPEITQGSLEKKVSEFRQNYLGEIYERIIPELNVLINGLGSELEIQEAKSNLITKLVEKKGMLDEWIKTLADSEISDSDSVGAIQALKDLHAEGLYNPVLNLIRVAKRNPLFTKSRMVVATGGITAKGKRADHMCFFSNPEELAAKMGPNAAQRNEVFVGTVDELRAHDFGKALTPKDISKLRKMAAETGGQVTCVFSSLKMPKRLDEVKAGSSSRNSARDNIENDDTGWGETILRKSGTTREEFVEADNFYRRSIEDIVGRIPEEATIDGKKVSTGKKFMETLFDKLKKDHQIDEFFNQKSVVGDLYGKVDEYLKCKKKAEGQCQRLESLGRMISMHTTTKLLQRDLQVDPETGEPKNPQGRKRAMAFIKATIYNNGGTSMENLRMSINPTEEASYYEIHQNGILDEAFKGLEDGSWNVQINDSGSWKLYRADDPNTSVNYSIVKTESAGKKDNYHDTHLEFSPHLVRRYGSQGFGPQNSSIESMIDKFLQNQKMILESLLKEIRVRKN